MLEMHITVNKQSHLCLFLYSFLCHKLCSLGGYNTVGVSTVNRILACVIFSRSLKPRDRKLGM